MMIVVIDKGFEFIRQTTSRAQAHANDTQPRVCRRARHRLQPKSNIEQKLGVHRVYNWVDKNTHECLMLLLKMIIPRLSGAPTRTRTADLLITNQLLYQLSYRGTADANTKRLACSQEGFLQKSKKNLPIPSL